MLCSKNMPNCWKTWLSWMDYAGDECLRHVAHVISAVAKRPGDLTARYGGEEFAVILPDTDETGALSVAGSMRFAVDKLALPHAASPVADHVTVSIGATSMVPERQRNLQELIDSADQALYRAKTMGRNQVCFQSTIHGEDTPQNSLTMW
jgi:diguanylate cyclase (GGDEF)-like protein